MTVTRYPNNLHRSYDCDYTIPRDAILRPHVAEAARQGPILKPKMDVWEDPDRNLVIATFELPGVSRDKIDIDVCDKRLTISGEVASFFGPNHDYILRERRTGPFLRTLELPADIPIECIGVTLEYGVLTVFFPRIPPA